MISWIMPAIAIAAVIYNTIVTHAFLRNDVKHLKQDVAENKDCLKKLMFHLMEKKE